jgi:hypothetical protein
VAHAIFALLPVDARARCACVCRGWCALLDDASLWTWLDLSDASGVTCRLTARVLLGAAARAGGALEALDVNREDGAYINQELLLQVITANAGTLRELHTGPGPCNVDGLAVLLRAAPALRTLSAGCVCETGQAPALLRNAPPYGPLRLHKLFASLAYDADGDASTLELAAALPAHVSLRSLTLRLARLQSDAVCGALVDAVQLQSLEFWGCAFAPASAPALARLLGGGTLSELAVRWCRGLLDEPASDATLAAALQASTTLTSLRLDGMGLWRAHAPGAVLLDALTAHPSLRKLVCSFNRAENPEMAAAAGAAFGALVAANAPALTELDLSRSLLRNAAMGPLCDALPRNTHLRSLDIRECRISETFAAERLLPALRANTSLRQLHAETTAAPSLAEAARLVNARAAAEAAAADA